MLDWLHHEPIYTTGALQFRSQIQSAPGPNELRQPESPFIEYCSQRSSTDQLAKLLFTSSECKAFTTASPGKPVAVYGHNLRTYYVTWLHDSHPRYKCGFGAVHVCSFDEILMDRLFGDIRWTSWPTWYDIGLLPCSTYTHVPCHTMQCQTVHYITLHCITLLYVTSHGSYVCINHI